MTMLWGRTGQKGFPRERLGRRPAVLGFYAWQYSGCPMKAGNLSESEGSDAFWVPFYSSIYLRESHVQGNRFDLENPGLLHYPHLAPGWRGVFTNKSILVNGKQINPNRDRQRPRRDTIRKMVPPFRLMNMGNAQGGQNVEADAGRLICMRRICRSTIQCPKLRGRSA